MKILLIACFVVSAGIAAAGHAEAGACAAGSCFAPALDNAGNVAKYTGMGSGKAWLVDCCFVGQRYKLVITNKATGATANAVYTFPASGVDTCDAGAIAALTTNQATLTMTLPGGADFVKVKALTGSGTTEEGPYLILNGSWNQTAGGDDCGL